MIMIKTGAIIILTLCVAVLTFAAVGFLRGVTPKEYSPPANTVEYNPPVVPVAEYIPCSKRVCTTEERVNELLYGANTIRPK